MSRHSSRNAAHRKLDQLLRKAAPGARHAGHPYWRLVNVVRERTTLLNPAVALERGNLHTPWRTMKALSRLAVRRVIWTRQPELWDVPVCNPAVQFRSLIQHLLDEYPVPDFMASVWTNIANSDWEHDLYLHLAQGRSVRQFAFPGWCQQDLTRSVCGFFMQAPDDLYPTCAMRWATVRAAGGCPRLARLIATHSAITTGSEDEPFWASVFRFLVKYQPISSEETLEMINFVDAQKFQPECISFGYPAGIEPLQPDFSMRGRTLMSLRRHMANWREELVVRRPELSHQSTKSATWQKSSIQPFSFENDQAVWTINELLSGRELFVEGVAMKHCVADYAVSCSEGTTTIWSMRCQSKRGNKRMMTIEVDTDEKLIIQAKGRSNCNPDQHSMGILRSWAEREGLSVNECL